MKLSGWRLILFARCRDATRITSDEFEGEVSRDRWWAARLHKLACGPCRRGLKQMRLLEEKLANAPTEVREQVRCACSTHGLSEQAAERIDQALVDARAGEFE